MRYTVASSFAAELARLEEEGQIESAGRLKIYCYMIDRRGQEVAAVKIWRGRAKKPYANYTFRSVDHRSQYVAQQIEADVQLIARAEQHKAEKRRRTAEMREKITAGTLLHNSWGYEQTNCHFYQVIERRGAYAIVRRIAGRCVQTTGWASELRSPCLDQFIGEPVRKLVGEHGVQFDHGYTSICEEDGKYTCTWYA